jgi:hypothetical protein
MQTQVQAPQAKEAQNVQGFIANPQVFKDTKRGVLVHRLGDELRIEMPINLYKKILDIPFEKKAQEPSEQPATRRNVYGLVARPQIFLSKDKNYLIHRVLGIRVSKHVNYYKRILAEALKVQANETALPA